MVPSASSLPFLVWVYQNLLDFVELIVCDAAAGEAADEVSHHCRLERLSLIDVVLDDTALNIRRGDKRGWICP